MFQTNLKKVRKEKNITLEQLSKITGISIGYLCHLEQGTRKNPSIEVMEKLSKALEKDVAELFFPKK